MSAPSEHTIQQSKLGLKGLIAFLIFGNMFIPLSTDIYLPALPSISVFFQAAKPLVNLTLTLFFICYAVGIVLWGPLSDKYGRRPFLICGSILHMLASLGCALSNSMTVLIAARMLQGFGAGAITTLTLAVVKDCFRDRQRETILGLIYTLCGLAPMVAPLLGAQLLRLGDWRLAFYMLAFFGFIDFLLCLLYEETLFAEECYRGRLTGAYGRLLVVLKTVHFFIPRCFLPCPAWPIWVMFQPLLLFTKVTLAFPNRATVIILLQTPSLRFLRRCYI
jgi:DHA1 family bicyclomycin/chloramphenicol resistance-like MFS transporter